MGWSCCNGGSQFTKYMAMMNLSAIIGYQLAPVFAENYNYQAIFSFASVLGTLVLLAALFIYSEVTDWILNSVVGRRWSTLHYDCEHVPVHELVVKAHPLVVKLRTRSTHTGKAELPHEITVQFHADVLHR